RCSTAIPARRRSQAPQAADHAAERTLDRRSACGGTRYAKGILNKAGRVPRVYNAHCLPARLGWITLIGGGFGDIGREGREAGTSAGTLDRSHGLLHRGVARGGGE